MSPKTELRYRRLLAEAELLDVHDHAIRSGRQLLLCVDIRREALHRRRMTSARQIGLVARDDIVVGLTYGDARMMLRGAEALEARALARLVSDDTASMSDAELLDVVATMIASGELLMVPEHAVSLLDMEASRALASIVDSSTANDACKGGGSAELVACPRP